MTRKESSKIIFTESQRSCAAWDTPEPPLIIHKGTDNLNNSTALCWICSAPYQRHRNHDEQITLIKSYMHIIARRTRLLVSLLFICYLAATLVCKSTWSLALTGQVTKAYQKESAGWTSDKRKRNGINVWSMWSVKKFYGLFVDAWNKGNKWGTFFEINDFQNRQQPFHMSVKSDHNVAITTLECNLKQDRTLAWFSK